MSLSFSLYNKMNPLNRENHSSPKNSELFTKVFETGHGRRILEFSTRNFEDTVMSHPDNHPCLGIIVFELIYLI